METLEDIAQMDGGIDVQVAASKLLSHWEWRDDEKAFGNQQDSLQSCSSSSPESSFDSMCSSPEMRAANVSACQAFANFPGYALPGQHSPSPCAPEKLSKPKMSTKRRVKASEREKMRMRSLAEALHHLREYLPPDYSRRGQPLTKIQTLKYTIEYIKELSDILNHG